MGQGKSNTTTQINTKRIGGSNPGPVSNPFQAQTGPGHGGLSMGTYLGSNKLNEIGSNASKQIEINTDPVQIYNLYGLISELGSGSVGLMGEDGVGLINENFKG